MFGRVYRAQSGHSPRACLPHWCCRTVLPDGAILFNLVCRKNFVPHHREIGAIWCNFKRFNTILKSEILLNVICKMTYVISIAFLFCIGNTKSLYFIFAFATQLASLQKTCYICFVLSLNSGMCCKSAWRHRCRYPCNWTNTIEEHTIVFCTWYLRNCTWC